MQKLNMSFVKYTALTLLLFTVYCCGSSEPVAKKKKIKTGIYTYMLTDSIGVMLTTGNINVDHTKGKDVSGTYTVIKDTSVRFDGMQTMNDGPFSGIYNDSLSLVFLNLNPRVADANIFINAYNHVDSLKGGWYYSTLRGKTSGGLFTAKRVK